MKMAASFMVCIMALAMTLTMSLATPIATQGQEDQHTSPTTMPSSINEPFHFERQTRLRGPNVVLAGNNPRASMTCDRFPRVCRTKGSLGPDCCRKRCVDVSTDNLNCGECGRRCRFGEMCCGGSCVNVLYDPKNCGGCKKRCKKGSFCNYGMCSYA